MSRITIKDIARLVKVNPSTVSRALKDHPDISEDTKRKIREVAEELGYRPNFQAIHFRNRRSGLIGLQCTATEPLNAMEPGWYAGPLSCSDGGSYYFYKVALELR